MTRSAEVSEEATIKYCGSDKFAELVKDAVKAQVEGDSKPMINRIITEYIDANNDGTNTSSGDEDETLGIREGLENA